MFEVSSIVHTLCYINPDLVIVFGPLHQQKGNVPKVDQEKSAYRNVICLW